MTLSDDESVFGKSMMKYFMYFIMLLSISAAGIGLVSPGWKSTIGNALQGEIVKLYGTLSTIAFFYMVMGEEKDAREMFRMAILLIAASSILTASYGASDSIAYGGFGIFGSMFAGKLLKKYISGGEGEAAIGAGIKSYQEGKGFSSGFFGSAVDKLGPEKGKDDTVRLHIVNVTEGILRYTPNLAALSRATDDVEKTFRAWDANKTDPKTKREYGEAKGALKESMAQVNGQKTVLKEVLKGAEFAEIEAALKRANKAVETAVGVGV